MNFNCNIFKNQPLLVLSYVLGIICILASYLAMETNSNRCVNIIKLLHSNNNLHFFDLNGL